MPEDGAGVVFLTTLIKKNFSETICILKWSNNAILTKIVFIYYGKNVRIYEAVSMYLKSYVTASTAFMKLYGKHV
jgi:hypothetical protein